MPDPTLDGRGRPEPLHDSGTLPAPAPSGPITFLSADHGDAPASHERLREAVRALTRERDYLREIRDVQLAEFESELAAHRELVQELRRLYGSERRAFREQSAAAERELATRAERSNELERDRDRWRDRARELDRTLAAQRGRLAELQQEFDAFRASAATLHPQLAELRACADALLADLDAHRDQARALLAEREASAEEGEALRSELDATRRDREAHSRERDAIALDRETLARERDELRSDRDAWRERAILAEARADLGLIGRWKRKLGRLLRRRPADSSAPDGTA